MVSWGLLNPGAFGWRSSAALALAALGDDAKAHALASEEVERARRWGTPRAIGVALRAAGLVEGEEAGLGLLREAVATLERSEARLEHARALTDLGAALRRRGRRSEARDPLSRGLEIARECGADALVHRAHTELWATGARPRTPVRTGLEALTPSERRVAELAAGGLSNPRIAQSLFVTVKTVEGHLRRTYAKLGIASRTELPAALAQPAASPPTD
jgi:DNA-binding CsgD family transcriptional regulator